MQSDSEERTSIPMTIPVKIKAAENGYGESNAHSAYCRPRWGLLRAAKPAQAPAAPPSRSRFPVPPKKASAPGTRKGLDQRAACRSLTDGQRPTHLRYFQ